ncbi:MAG TPA: SDR family oxidoreductase [Longimicrobiales bacterium]|nr:SDR family oxidoreductase [Longimicrobiales bacterium]
MTPPEAWSRGWALVTGASGGLGADMARILAARGFPLVLTARSAPDLEDLARELGEAHGTQVRLVPMDLSSPGAGDALADAVEATGIPVEVLVNNAGFGQWGPWVEQDAEEEAAMLRLNVEALTVLARRMAPGMVAQGYGRILNVGSVAGFFPGPLMTVYYATKAYVLSFSEALAEELRGTGVTVTCLCPGPVRTGFQDRAALSLPRVTSPAVVPSREVARAGIEGMFRGRARVVPGLLNKLSVWAPRFLPRTLVPKLVFRIQRRRGQRGKG